MRPIRKWLLTAGVVLALLLPLGTIASADPGTHTRPATTTQTTSDPGDGGIGY